MAQPAYDATVIKTVLNHLPLFIGWGSLEGFELQHLNEPALQKWPVPLPTDLTLFFREQLHLPLSETCNWKEILHKGESIRRSMKLPKNGINWAELQLDPLPGNLLLLRITDLSTTIKTQENLLQEIQKFEALVNYASMGILLVNARGEIVLANPFLNKQFGYRPGELLGKTVEALIPKRFHQKHISHREQYNRHPTARAMGSGLELFGRKKNGTEFPVQISLGHFENEAGRFTLAFVFDDSERKANEAALLQQKAELEAVNQKMKQLNELLEFKVAERTQMLQDTLKELEQSRDNLTHALEKEKQLNDMKSRFVSMASHEFRTPLSTILSSITLLSKYTTTEEQPKREKHIDRIKASVTTLTDILNEFLSLGKIEDGKVEPKWAQFSLPELVQSVLRQMEPLRKSGQQLRHQHSGSSTLVLDPGLLKNILINLISNAIKFSPEKSAITIITKIEGEDITIQVCDEGLGISKEDQQHLFERFFRGANVTNIQGTGLGLHIVSRYVQLMNGSISCQSQLNAGTTFTIRFKQHKFEYEG
ncbi:MAG: ATP-binding protein [Lacibacter sp.]|jgi:PAS domain S-box-containing protein